MQRSRALEAMCFGVVVLVAGSRLWTWQNSPVLAQAIAATPDVAVGPQYDTTHVYVAPEDFDRFVASLVATFGGTTSKQGVFTVTPTPSSTMSQLVLTPVGTVSVFGFKTPVPYPFGLERTGYLVTDLDAAVRAARASGGDVIVAPFDDPIGRDAIVQWPGGVNMQLYWHTTAPSYASSKRFPRTACTCHPTAPTRSSTASSPSPAAKSASDDPNAPGIEIGRPGDAYRRVRIASTFGKSPCS